MSEIMKARNFFTKIAILPVCILFLFGCELQEANINPNNPTKVPPNVMLPYIEESIARLTCGTSQVMSGIFVQYYTGIDNHPLQVQQYILNEALYVDWIWNDYYDGPMINLGIMIKEAEAIEAFYYSGIGKILLANCFGNLTSVYGGVPYKQALEGSVNSNPVYDPQQEIYEGIQQLLDNGIEDLQKNYDGLKPGPDDIIYGGNVTKWLEAAYSLKARYYMHLSKRADEVGYNPAQKAIEAAAKGIKSSASDLVYNFGYSAAEYNPFYSYTLLNYIIPNINFTAMLTQMIDPRRTFYYKRLFGESNLNGVYFTSSNSPVFFVTYHELKLIEAEARLRINPADPKAQDALQEGVRASIKKITGTATTDATIDAYIVRNATLTGDYNSDLQKIMIQKYIAMFSSIESWTDYRRTGIPQLVPNVNGDHNQNPGGAIPRRFNYPQTERLYNQNFPEYLPNLQDRMWLDK